MLGQGLMLLVAAIAIAAALVLRRRDTVTVYGWQQGLLYRNGVFARALAPGRYRLSQLTASQRVALVPITEQLIDQTGIEVVSADSFAFRIDATVTARITDPRLAYESTASPGIGWQGTTDWMSLAQVAGLTQRIAAAAIAAAGARPLSDALKDAQALAADIAVRLGAPDHGTEVVGVVVTRVQLPPETRRLLTEVESARLRGQATLERARAEQAALRALANAARMLRDNPELAQLRLLQSVDGAKGPTTIVLGGGQGASLSG